MLGLASHYRVRILICLTKPSRERVKVNHVIVEWRVINHHPITKVPGN